MLKTLLLWGKPLVRMLVDVPVLGHRRAGTVETALVVYFQALISKGSSNANLRFQLGKFVLNGLHCKGNQT